MMLGVKPAIMGQGPINKNPRDIVKLPIIDILIGYWILSQIYKDIATKNQSCLDRVRNPKQYI